MHIRSQGFDIFSVKLSASLTVPNEPFPNIILFPYILSCKYSSPNEFSSNLFIS